MKVPNQLIENEYSILKPVQIGATYFITVAVTIF